MSHYSIPADFKEKTIELYAQMNKNNHKNKITETYGQFTIGNTMGSGRLSNVLPNIDISGLENYIRLSDENGIKFHYTLNLATMVNEEYAKQGTMLIIGFLKQLHSIGVKSLTVTLPSMIEIVKLSGLEFQIKASAICQIDTVNKAKAFAEMGVNRIVIDESLNRDFRTLKEIRTSFGENVELIANSFCYNDCIYKSFHYDQIAIDSIGKGEDGISSNYFAHRCMMQRLHKPENVLKLGWIRPEDINLYNQIGIENFKIQGRQAALKGNITKVAEAYMNESYDGDLFDLLDLFQNNYSFRVSIDNKKLDHFITPFYDNKDFCQNDCEHCGYCTSFMKQNLQYDQALSTTQKASTFYIEYDQFINQVKHCNQCADTDDSELDFGFTMDI